MLLVEFPPAPESKRVWGSIRQGLHFKTPFPARKLLYLAAGVDYYARHLVRAAFGVQPTRKNFASVSKSSFGHVASAVDVIRAVGAPEVISAVSVWVLAV